MTDQTLEILIGKHLDGQTTPGEEQLLQTALKENPKARELLEQLQNLQQLSRQAVSSEVLEQGKSVDEIFEQAWQEQTKYPSHRKVKAGSYLRFTAGLAAGLIIGLSVHLALTFIDKPNPQIGLIPLDTFASMDNRMAPKNTTMSTPPSNSSDNAIRNVDWYSFTDEKGDQWLVEGLRESVIRPAAYERRL